MFSRKTENLKISQNHHIRLHLPLELCSLHNKKPSRVTLNYSVLKEWNSFKNQNSILVGIVKVILKNLKKTIAKIKYGFKNRCWKSLNLQIILVKSLNNCRFSYRNNDYKSSNKLTWNFIIPTQIDFARKKNSLQ